MRDLIAARGRNSACHNNGIKSRRVNSDGWVVQTSG